MPYAFHTVDVFTDHLHGGNPLAVVPDARGLSEAQMQAITREFNYSETVFVFPPEQSRNTRRVRIFTPGSELPFAGHPTVGCAFVLAAIGEIPLNGDETRIVLEEG
ncbi:MAG TPA: PhzF family phenazine biosynthesis isomerase, partial [Gemmatimonadaceae bacterium]